MHLEDYPAWSVSKLGTPLASVEKALVVYSARGFDLAAGRSLSTYVWNKVYHCGDPATDSYLCCLFLCVHRSQAWLASLLLSDRSSGASSSPGSSAGVSPLSFCCSFLSSVFRSSEYMHVCGSSAAIFGFSDHFRSSQDSASSMVSMVVASSFIRSSRDLSPWCPTQISRRHQIHEECGICSSSSAYPAPAHAVQVWSMSSRCSRPPALVAAELQQSSCNCSIGARIMLVVAESLAESHSRLQHAAVWYVDRSFHPLQAPPAASEGHASYQLWLEELPHQPLSTSVSLHLHLPSTHALASIHSFSSPCFNIVLLKNCVLV